MSATEHDPATCPQCKAQRARLRHPVYARTRRLLFIPRQATTGGA